MAKKPSPGRIVHLPSGARVRARTTQPQATGAEKPKRRALFDDTRALLETGALAIELAETKARLDPLALEALPLADFHVLRDFAIRSGLVESPAEAFPCDNCDAPLPFDGASLPVEDLEDRYLDEPKAEELVIPFPEPVGTAGGAVERVRMRPVTLREAAPLHRELGRGRPFRITPALVRAMGIVRLEGKATMDEPRAIARALDDASDASWAAVERGFLSLAYPPRAIAVLVCSKCETVHEIEVPVDREFEPSQYEPRRDDAATFPSAEVFEDHVERVAGLVFDRMDVSGLTLRVEPGVPDVDEGGVPMLGSYGPEPNDEGRTDFVVTLYYRTFEHAFRDDARFDWESEVEETIEHEIQHHLYYLAGHDPMDEAERRETDEDAVRRAGGRARLRKLQRAALARDALAIARVLGPLLAGVGLVAVLFLRCS